MSVGRRRDTSSDSNVMVTTVIAPARRHRCDTNGPNAMNTATSCASPGGPTETSSPMPARSASSLTSSVETWRSTSASTRAISTAAAMEAANR